jgi:pectin methylesterase-like acyl-CoA thioesterase
MFAVILFMSGIEWMENGGANATGGKEGLSALAKTAKSSDDATPTPIETSAQPSASKNASKLSACGDGCDSYETIQATLDSFNKLNKKQENSTAAIQKVDKDILKLSESVKNMGAKKVPGGKPELPKKM